MAAVGGGHPSFKPAEQPFRHSSLCSSELQDNERPLFAAICAVSLLCHPWGVIHILSPCPLEGKATSGSSASRTAHSGRSVNRGHLGCGTMMKHRLLGSREGDTEPLPRLKVREDTGTGTGNTESTGTLGVRSRVSRDKVAVVRHLNGVAILGDIPGCHSLWDRAGYWPLLGRTCDHTAQCPTVPKTVPTTVGHPRCRQC